MLDAKDKPSLRVSHVHCPFCFLNKTFAYPGDASDFASTHFLLHLKKGEYVR